MAIRNFLVFRHTHLTSILLGCKALAFGVQNMAGDNLTLLCLMHVFTTFTCSLKNHVAHNTRSGEVSGEVSGAESTWALRRGEPSENRKESQARRETRDHWLHRPRHPIFCRTLSPCRSSRAYGNCFLHKKTHGAYQICRSCKDEVLQIINYPDHQPLTTHWPPHQPPQKIIR
jgi:hypothetical protein